MKKYIKSNYLSYGTCTSCKYFVEDRSVGAADCLQADNMTEDEATHQLNYVRELIDEALICGDYDEVEDIVASELGLEMDYIYDIMMV